MLLSSIKHVHPRRLCHVTRISCATCACMHAYPLIHILDTHSAMPSLVSFSRHFTLTCTRLIARVGGAYSRETYLAYRLDSWYVSAARRMWLQLLSGCKREARGDGIVIRYHSVSACRARYNNPTTRQHVECCRKLLVVTMCATCVRMRVYVHTHVCMYARMRVHLHSCMRVSVYTHSS